jgi:hypothetical protein
VLKDAPHRHHLGGRARREPGALKPAHRPGHARVLGRGLPAPVAQGPRDEALIPQFGDACLQSRGDAFTTLARSIVGQQISVKAAQTRVGPLREAAAPHDVRANVLKLKVDDMRGRRPVGAQDRIPGGPGAAL